jgi:hypothetical protein
MITEYDLFLMRLLQQSRFGDWFHLYIYQRINFNKALQSGHYGLVPLLSLIGKIKKTTINVKNTGLHRFGTTLPQDTLKCEIPHLNKIFKK